MFQNYIKIALRNLRQNKGFSFINIFGLSVGMAVAMLIGLWIYDELSFDTCHENYETLGQVMTTQTFNGETGTGQAVAIPLSEELKIKYPKDFRKVAMASWNFGHIIAYGENKFSKDGMWVQPELPEMLTLKMLKGNIKALSDPSSILLTESLSKILFGELDPMNKLVKLDNKTFFKVAGVYKDLPYNSEFHNSNFFIPWDKYLSEQQWLKDSQTQWNNHSFQLFVQLNRSDDFERITAKIKDVPMKHLNAATDGKEEILLHPMCEWHLRSEFKNGHISGGRIQFVWLFGIIGTFVLLLACINFMNLSTARSEKRAKEVGVRKAIGSERRQLINQFLSESLLVVFMAFILAIILVQLSLPTFFNELADKKISIPFGNPLFWLICISFTLFTGLVSGSYPAFYLSSFEPVKVLKGTFRVGKYASLPRKILVVVQFTVSVTLIIGTIIVFKQIQYAKSRPVGYNREGMISISMNTPELYGHYDALRNDLIKTGAVENMAESSSPTTGVYSNQIGFDWKGKDPNAIPLFGIVSVSWDFGKTVHWKIKEGRDFSRDYGTDTLSLILNEAAIKLTGLKNPIGETIKWNDKKWKIIGIVKDLVMESPFRPIKPTVFLMNMEWVNIITVRLKPGLPVRESLAKIEPVFKRFNPGSPFDYNFVDEEYAKKFQSEERVGKLASVFAVLAILISCLGLFGLASFMAEQRTKEIGVRKVLGASVFNLWSLLSKDFIKLVVISILIAAPSAYFLLSNWLQNYEYRSEISWWVFLVSGAGAIFITLATVSYQAISAALANPVKSLRTE